MLVFEELIRDNDTTINADFVVSNSKVNQPDPTGFQDNNGCDLIEVEVRANFQATDRLLR